jgi:ABC-type nitrate/sulfonate/bicarbonate transport system substrate-binding protein
VTKEAIKMKKVLIAGIIIVVVVVVGLTLYFGRTSPSHKANEQTRITNVSVRMKWFFAGTMTGWFAGKEEGIFKKHGIDLTINPGGPQNSSVKLVAAGSDDFGVAGADEVILARAKGIPIVAIAVLFKESPLCYISRANSGIKRPADWRGKRIEVSYGENAEYQFRALLKKAGLTKNDYIEVPYTFNVAPFLEGKVDVSPAYAMDQAIVIENQGIKLTKIFAKDFGINPYADVIITTEQTIAQRPDLVNRFVAAALESHRWAILNPEKAVDDLVTQVPDLKKEDQSAVWSATIPYIVPDNNLAAIGYMDQKRWSETEQVLIDSGALKKRVDISSVYTNKFLPANKSD